MSTFAALAAAEEATHTELPIPAWLIGLIALLVFVLLLGVTWSFRGTHHRYAPPSGHGETPGAPAAGDGAHWPEHPGQH